MNSKLKAVAEAMEADPDLRTRLLMAQSVEERVAILTEAGLPVPTADDVAEVDDSALAGLSAAGSGAGVHDNLSDLLSVLQSFKDR